MNIHKYYYDDYYNDISEVVKKYSRIKNPHIVGVYRDSLPVAVHLSNVMKCPLSIVKIEDDKARWLINHTEDRDIRPNDCPLFPLLIVVDINYGTGNSFRAIKQLPEFVQNPDYNLFSIFGNQNEDRVFYKYEQIYNKIILPWHLTKDKNNENLL